MADGRALLRGRGVAGVRTPGPAHLDAGQEERPLIRSSGMNGRVCLGDEKYQLIHADVLAGLARIPDESVQCVVTSPPYWALRDYGTRGQIGHEPTPGEYVT